ncbi:Beta-galactosidase-1-like protein 2 [Liparis tanakae]|uniref:Beta-galactosidase-1-like protein 2 n=1 Tax=Liparis tanakae TaxID=230148 RepID=A0A4Z2IF59_9TELE|nr:Beta-galactosidase-1-like protein 2 [Liparis tanakae]
MSRKVGLSANASQFTLEGEPFRVLGGSVHYFRVPRAYWRDRLMKMKACGINTLTTYVPWSLHQPERGVFNFHTQLDLVWLLRDGSMRLRTTHPGFTQAVNTFFDKLIPRVVPLQFKKGGPIIAVQVENDYGSFAKDESYMLFIKEALQSKGISELLLTSDYHNTLKSGGVDGAIRSLKLQKLNQREIQDLNAIQPNSPTMVMDYWTGWHDVWGDLHHVLPPEGGGSFPDMPALHYRESYEPAIMYQHLSLWDALSFTEGPFKSAKPVSMENLPVNNGNGQSYGYTLYEASITNRSYIGLFKRQNLELAVPDGKAPWRSLPATPSFPGFFMGRLFAYGYPSDTFVKLPGWEKGVVFINGLNLGRYWSIGPQQALYLPGPFLNSGINQAIVFEEQEGDYKVHFEDTPDLGMAADIQ